MKEIKDTLSSRTFIIPLNQRGFNWRKGNAEALTRDLELLVSPSAHYLGPIIATSKPEANFEDSTSTFINAYIIDDGQQRITSITIFIHLLALRLQALSVDVEGAQKPEIDLKVAELNKCVICRKFGGVDELRIKNEKPEFDMYLRRKILGESVPLPAGRTVSMNCVDEVYNYFEEFCRRINTVDGGLKWAARILSSAKIIFVDLKSDNIDRFLAFDAINSRGLGLTEFDKLKNFCILLQQRRDGLQVETDREWYTALVTLEKYNASSRKMESTYIAEAYSVFSGARVQADNLHESFVGSFHSLLEAGDSFKESRVVKFVKFWRKYAEGFGYISCARRKDIDPGKCSTMAHRWLTSIDQMGYPSIMRPVLAAGLLANFSREEFAELSYICEIYLFRTYALRGRRTDANRPAINALAHEILFKDSASIVQVKARVCKWLKDLASLEEGISFLCDGGAKYYFDSKMRGWSHSYYFLYQYELKCSPATTEPIRWNTNAEDQKASIEHILPQSSRDGGYWERVWNEEHIADAFKHRLGNLVLTSNNQALGRKEIQKKIQDDDYCYDCDDATSAERKVSQYVDGVDWTTNSILQRELELIKFAMERWTFGCCSDNFSLTLPAEFKGHNGDRIQVRVEVGDCIEDAEYEEPDDAIVSEYEE